MKPSGRILFISNGGEEHNSPGLRQALKLSQSANSELTLIYLYPDLPEKYRDLHKKFEDFLETGIRKSLDAARLDLGIAEDDLECSVIVREAAKIPPAITIIRDVISTGYDLVIKDAEPISSGKGFRGMDMTLLRKCPAPVCLARPSSHSGNDVRITVAIDPESREQGEHELSLELLREGASLIDIFDGVLDIVSCWEYEFEKILRYKAWITIPESELHDSGEEVRITHQRQLKKLIEESGIRCEYHVHHMRGKPEELIPGFIDQRATDILVMGSVGRTGIPGFLIGNTAENIFERIPCTLLALKPEGFVSPVTP
jgi:universal stress protein E